MSLGMVWPFSVSISFRFESFCHCLTLWSILAGTYAASKAAEEVMADTLRLELAPFHIKVLSVVNGATETMAQSYFEDWKLPDGSLYASIESKIREKAQGNDGAPRSDPMQHAKQLVGEITRGKSGKLWCGASAGTVKFATSYLPTSIVVSQSPAEAGFG